MMFLFEKKNKVSIATSIRSIQKIFLENIGVIVTRGL